MVQKMPIFFSSFNSSQFYLICDSEANKLKHKSRLFESVCGVFHFLLRFVFIKVYIFVQQNEWTLWLQNVIILFKIKIIEKQLTVLFFLLQQEAWKFNDICVVGAPQNLTWWQIFETLKIEVLTTQFSSIVTVK